MSEKVEQPLPVSIASLRAESYSAGDDSIVISLSTKYSTAERRYSVPVECFHDLIDDLRRLSASTAVTPSDNANSEVEPLLPLEAPQAAE